MGGREGIGILLGLAAAAGAAALVLTGRERGAARLAAVTARLERIPRRTWLAAVIVGGAALRIAWVLLFPAPFTSDGADYYHLGAHLARGETLQIAANEALRATRIAILAQESAANGGKPMRWS